MLFEVLLPVLGKVSHHTGYHQNGWVWISHSTLNHLINYTEIKRYYIEGSFLYSKVINHRNSSYLFLSIQ